MDRFNHYEVAFAALLRAHQVCHVAVDESHRSPDAERGTLKSLDFIVHGANGRRWLIDVKGRRYVGRSARRCPESWATRDDVTSTGQWTRQFGPGYEALFVFSYAVASPAELPGPRETTFSWQDRHYFLRAVRTADYQENMRTRSPRWNTVHLPASRFRELARPLHCFLPELEPTPSWALLAG